MATISGRLGITGTVVVEGVQLRWNITAPSAANFLYGDAADIPLIGDWDGNGIEGIGVYRPSTTLFYLRQTASQGNQDVMLAFGASGDTPISWFDTTSGKDRVGLTRGSSVYLEKDFSGTLYLQTTTADIICYTPTVKQCAFTLTQLASISGRLGMIGTVSKSTTLLIWNITTPSIGTFIYGSQAMIPLVGDWNGDGIEGIGAYDPSTYIFHLRQTASAGPDESPSCAYGNSGDIPISWYDSGAALPYDGIGVIRGSIIYLSRNFTCDTHGIMATTADMVCYSPLVKQCNAAILTVTSITGTTTTTVGTTTATFTATVRNSGTASGTAIVTFYKDVTILGAIGTSSIAPGSSQSIPININPSTWTIGTYSICAKTNYET